MKIILLVLIMGFVLYACTGKSQLKNNRSAISHFDHLAHFSHTANADVAAKFSKLYSDLKVGATAENIKSVYAQDIYFNDTFRIITNRDELIQYLTETAEFVNSTTVEILDVAKGSTDYFVKWSMKMNFEVKGNEVDSFSLGVTQLRFNEQGLIVFHQDFWDSSEAFFEHLPLVGRIVKSIKSKL
ncbi:MAG: nuclear transport factor 2 family protein [Marinicella sp.]